ncbi:MAG: hypothetical protein OEP45_04355 [Acidobacteriota bacterium]|nr:hypothetical protein [Acidobacteriota bacterium]
MADPLEKTPGALRRFGFAFGGGLTVLGSLLWWRGKVPAPWVLGVAGLVLVLAALLPRALAPLEWLMAKVFSTVTQVLTYALLTILFLVVLTPLGLIRRLLGKESLGLEPDPTRQSYWIDVDPEGPASRPRKPF